MASTPAEKVNHQQVGNVWATENEIVSVSLSGDLNVIDRRSGGKPARVLHVSRLELFDWQFLRGRIGRLMPSLIAPPQGRKFFVFS